MKSPTRTQAIHWVDNCQHLRQQPNVYMHTIFLEEGYKQNIEPQRCLNPIMELVMKKELLKWLDAEIIYLIADSS